LKEFFLELRWFKVGIDSVGSLKVYSAEVKKPLYLS
jgi:hypothetical protein